MIAPRAALLLCCLVASAPVSLTAQPLSGAAPSAAGSAAGSAQGVGLELLLEAAILPEVEALFPAGARLEFMLPETAPARALRLVAVEHDLRAGAFATILETPDGAQQTLRGRVFAVVDSLVPVRPILPGEITKPADFELRTLPAHGLGRHALSDPALILGQEVRRTLPEGRAVQSQSLRPPRVVQRGEKLTLLYSNGALQLSAPARALEDAAQGDTIKVQNLNSNKTVMARALGDGRVQVTQ
jgi:flagella basal body P-ring formation protein FlgA